MKKHLLLLILILCLAFTLTGFSADLFGTYDQRIKLTVDHTKIDSALTWFPVTVSLTSGQGEEVFAEFDADADYLKVAFTKADGTTQLYAEKELFDVSESLGIYHVSRDGWEIPIRNSAWTKQGIVIEPATGWDSVGEPTVLYEGNPEVLTEEENVFKMWYREYDYSEVEDCQICYAESVNGTDWTKYGSNPVVNVGEELNTCPFVFKDGSTYHMYVHSDWSNIDKYSSADGVDWAKNKDNTLSVGAADEWDDHSLGNLFVWKEGASDWRMLYGARAGTLDVFKIGYATSTDGETWSKSEENPVLSGTGMVGSAELHKIYSTYYLWHSTSVSGNLPTDISWAKSTDLISWTKYTTGNPVFFRSEDYEGVGNAEGQVADVSIIEVNGTTYMFYGAVPDQTPPPDQTIALATTSLTIAQLVQEYTDFYMYYDNDAGDNTTYIGAINTTPGATVWDANFKAVYHMVDATISTIVDSTSNNNDGTKKDDNEPVEATGKVGQGQDFDGSDDYIDLGTSANFNDVNFTITSVANVDALTTTKIYTPGLSTLDSFYARFQEDAGDGDKWKLNTGVYKSPDWGAVWGDEVSIDTDYFISAKYDGTTLRQRINYGTEYTVEDTHTPDVSEDDNVFIGSVGTPADYWFFNGIISEARYSDTARADAWLKATYNSLWDTLLTYGSEETPAGITWNGVTITKWNGITITKINGK